MQPGGKLMVEFIDTIDVNCTLGESPVWDERLQRLWWTDIQERRLFRWDWNEPVPIVIELPERLGSLGLTSDPQWLVTAFASGFALFHPASETLRWLDRPEAEYRGIRFNDGRVDRQGRFWAGTMVEDRAHPPKEGGSLYRLSYNGKAIRLFNEVAIANSVCFSVDRKSLFFADSPTRQILKYTLEPDGRLSEPTCFAVVDSEGVPDGSDIDAEGYLWNAEWGASRITRYRPDGTVEQHIPVPVSQPTCIAFGGPEMNHMFVTSARENLDPDELERQPDAGKVLILRALSKGLATPRFPLQHLKEWHDDDTA